MYTKQQASVLKKQFWTRFGQYLRPIPGADGELVNWLNYKTGKRHLYFRMDAGAKEARIGIEFRHPTPEERHHYFEQWKSLSKVFGEAAGTSWSWEQDTFDEDGNTISRISESVNGISVYNENDWPAIISFLKPRMLGLDRFWTMMKDGLD